MRNTLAQFSWRTANPQQATPTPSTIPFYYCGNLTAAQSLFTDYPINSDDMPRIEYLTPRLFREQDKSNPIIWFVGPKLANMVEQIQSLCPPATDPALRNTPPNQRRLIKAGKAFHWALIAKVLGETRKSQAHWMLFKREWQNAANCKSVDTEE
jgi:hypothetical protein